MDRKTLTFAQAEGVADLPRQLALKEVSRALRVRLSKIFVEALIATKGVDRMYPAIQWVGEPWATILYDKHVELDEEFPATFDNAFRDQAAGVQSIFVDGSYVEIFNFVQYVLRHSKCPHPIPTLVDRTLIETGAAYRVADRDTIVPFSSAAEGDTALDAIESLSAFGAMGAQQHLKLASSNLNSARWADSVRESVHAVEGAVRHATGSKSVADALKRLRQQTHINPNLSKGIEALYNYTSDESGIRHALLEEGDARVDEADALFMYGAAASFIGYLVRKTTSGTAN